MPENRGRGGDEGVSANDGGGKVEGRVLLRPVSWDRPIEAMCAPLHRVHHCMVDDAMVSTSGGCDVAAMRRGCEMESIERAAAIKGTDPRAV